MRQIVLDTETTGLDHRLGDRVIEIGCVEIVARKLTGRRFHRYLNPERRIDAGAQAVHGISDEFLLDKPRFQEVSGEFIDFIAGSELVIHNASFDVGFLNHELSLARLPALEQICGGVCDTLTLARELHPGRRNSLDALCDRYEIDNAHRSLHGALLDAELLAEVFLAMTRGQESLIIDVESKAECESVIREIAVDRSRLCVLRASPEELAAHDSVIEDMWKGGKGCCLWAARPDPALD
ncbi:MAG: DNA polymerase III subunit epsilon [Betaproteobacteria bacterium]|nr:DNA polymerase III subunit epsilon [Betaproteobacteria bacterium]